MSFLGLIWFRTKALNVFKSELNYDVATPGHQQENFNRSTRGAYEKNLNEYDAVIAFMLIEFKLLSRPITDFSREFYIDKLSSLNRISFQSKMGKQFIEIYLEDYKSDFTPEMLERWELSFVKDFLKREENLIQQTPTPTVHQHDVNETSEKTLESKLVELKTLKDKGLITDDQFNTRTMELLRTI